MMRQHYPYEDIAKEYLDQLIPGRAELFGKDPLEKAKENHDTGIPLVRAMVLEFPGDPVCGFLDRQYMLGDRYLVAPVMDETGETRQGALWITETVDYFTIPLWERVTSD